MGRDRSEQEVLVDGTVDEVFVRASAAFRSVGRVKSEQPALRRVSGTIRAGHGRLNSATVTARVEPAEGSSSRLVVEALAREGLVNQGTVAGAISRLLDAL